MAKIALIATPEEVTYLQMIRDKRLAGQTYKTDKTAFFKAFKAKYGITSKTRIKIETEKAAKLGVTQYCGNSAKVMIEAPASAPTIPSATQPSADFAMSA